MIYVRLAGGLGNQLFQILHAISISKPDEKITVLSNSMDKFKTPREVQFNSIIQYESLQIIGRPSILTRLLVSRLRLGRLLYLVKKRYNVSSFSLGLIKINCPKIVDGYFQAPSMSEIDRFFKLVTVKKPTIQNDFQNIATTFDCCLHLRGGDFLLPENKSLNICSFNYYFSAVQSAFLAGFKNFLIIGNDYGYSVLLRDRLRDNFPSCKFVVHSQDYSSIQDFTLMTHFDAFILSNSTFSWWAARFACRGNDNVTIYGPSFFEINRRYPPFPCRHIAIDPTFK